MGTRNIVIVQGRCSRTRQGYGIRFERRSGNEWAATWAFAIKDAVAKREGYASARMDGTFTFDESFPGCPHCDASGFFVCRCGKLGCWSGQETSVTCPSCGQSGELSGDITSLAGGTDR